MTITPLLFCAPDSVVAAAASQPKDQDAAAKYPSLGAAVKAVLKPKPQVIAFGEIHPDPGYNYTSTKLRFMQEILPALKANNIQVLVLEWIRSDPRIEAEINLFNQGKAEIGEEQTPVLWRNINYSDKKDLIAILYRCRELKVRVEAGGMTLEQSEETIKRTDYNENVDLKKKAAVYTGKAMLNKLLILLRTNPKLRLAAFGGIDHNNINDSDEHLNNGIVYGRQLSNKLGKRYVEVDLIAPEEGKTADIALGITGWRKYIPKNGVVSLNRANSTFIFLPFSALPKK